MKLAIAASSALVFAAAMASAAVVPEATPAPALEKRVFPTGSAEVASFLATVDPAQLSTYFSWAANGNEDFTKHAASFISANSQQYASYLSGKSIDPAQASAIADGLGGGNGLDAAAAAAGAAGVAGAGAAGATGANGNGANGNGANGNGANGNGANGNGANGNGANGDGANGNSTTNGDGSSQANNGTTLVGTVNSSNLAPGSGNETSSATNGQQTGDNGSNGVLDARAVAISNKITAAALVFTVTVAFFAF